MQYASCNGSRRVPPIGADGRLVRRLSKILDEVVVVLQPLEVVAVTEA